METQNVLLSQLPYCGTPPVPAELWSRWNLDPILLGVLVALMIWHARRVALSGAAGPHPRARRGCFIAGWAALTLGLVSPICALSVALFSARIAQHMWLVLIAAPLLALASAPARERRDAPVQDGMRSPLSAATVFAACLWLWHSPRLYALTFSSDVTYWLMHITLIGSALWLWRSMNLGNGLARTGIAFLTFLQMGLLGALLTLAPRVLYAPHMLTASNWGLSPLEDQQLGGLIMWIPAGFVLVFAALFSVLALLRTSAMPRQQGT